MTLKDSIQYLMIIQEFKFISMAMNSFNDLNMNYNNQQINTIMLYQLLISISYLLANIDFYIILIKIPIVVLSNYLPYQELIIEPDY